MRADGFGAGGVSTRLGKGEDFLPPGFLGIAALSTVRGNAVVMSEENESMMIRLVFGAGWFCVV